LAGSSIVSELGFIVSFVGVRAIYCFLNQSSEPFLELPGDPSFQIPNIQNMTHFKTFAGIICDSGAASISDCQVFVDEGMTNPKSKYHSMDMNKNNNFKKRIKLQYSVWNSTVEK